MRLNSIFDYLPAGGALADSKDRLISARIKQELNIQLAQYGQVLDVKLNTREQNVELSMALKGESEPITVKIGKYSLTKENDQLWLAVDSQAIEASREWVALLLQDQARRQKLPIPQKSRGWWSFWGEQSGGNLRSRPRRRPRPRKGCRVTAVRDLLHAPGGEPLWRVADDLAIFRFSVRFDQEMSQQAAPANNPAR